MKTILRFPRVFVLALVAAATASADPPDLTASLEPLCNPNASRWTASQPMARAATSIGVCDGLLFVSGGDWDDNLGPCPIFAVNPYTGSYTKEYESGTESIDYFRIGSDGSLYAPSVDPREGHANECSVARRKPDGTWTKLYAPNRWIYYSSAENANYGTHNWDFAIWKGRIFTAGYGLGVGTELTTTRLTDATPQITNANRTYASQYGGTFSQSRRFYAFLPFEDDLFCYPLTYSGTGSTSYNSIGGYDYEEWRFDESTSRFVCQTNKFSNVTPGLARSDLSFIPSATYMNIQLWHPTAFKGRVLYIAGRPEMTTLPFALYTAENVNHSVRATRVNLGSGVFPFDIFVHGDVMTVLAAQYDSSTQKAVNSVWESTDGVSFEKKFTFTTVQNANAIAWCDGAYYVAMGARQVVQEAWTFAGTDEVGKIYRIRDPDYADAIEVVAESATVSIPEGGTTVARFKLAAQPSAAVTAAVRIAGNGVPAVSTALASLAFTPQDWNTWHEVPISAADDDLDAIASASLLCGAGDPAVLRAASIIVTPVNNDFRVADVPPDGLVDITVPYGDFTSSSSVSINTNNPFNDDPSGTNTANRFLVQSKSATIAYDFGNPATVNGYGIHNFVPAGYSPAERAPHTWTFQASNDGKNWTTLDERHLESGWTAGEYRYYAVSNETAYTQYRLAITDNNGNAYTQFARLEFYGTGTSLVGLTRASTGGLYTNSASHATYGAKGAFDNNRTDTNGRWLATKADHMFVVYKFNEATAVNMLRVWNGSNSGGGASSAERSPRAWTFQASNDGENWTTLDARTNEPDWSASGEVRDYPFENDTAYTYYKFDCTELCSASATYLQLWELEFYYIADEGGGGGEPPDLTSEMEYLGNPAYSRWPSSGMSRHVQDLFPYKGKIYTSGGEWDTNTGPCPIWAVDPYSGAYTNEFDAGTDAIYEFKAFTDGRLYTSAIDPHEGAANIGSIFRRGSNDVWYAYNTACTACNITNFGSSAYQGYRIHNWDMAEYKDYVFVCGYGISGSTNWCTTAMFDTTPQLRNIDRHCGPVSWTIPGRTYGATASDYQLLRRFCTFLPFDDDVYCFPDQPTFWDKITHFNWEEWRFNESTKKFVCQTNTWANIAPGITLEAASFTHPSNDAAQVQLWHPTKFGPRVLYIVGGHGDYGFNITPWAAYSAVNENHHVKATKIDLGGDDVKPFDVCVANGAAYLVAAQAGLKATMVTNSVWKSTDGVSFSKLFTFVSTRQASAICYHDGCFYLGMGSNAFTKNGWPKVLGSDIAGRIYRVRLPQGEPLQPTAVPATVAAGEGGAGSVSFRLSAAPASNVTLRVWSTDPRVVPSVATLSFTPANWNAAQAVPFAVGEDDESDADYKAALLCGTGGADCASAYAVVQVANNDGRVIETPPAGLVDLTRPDGVFETTVPAGVTLTYNKPFNDCDSNTNKEERLVAKATTLSVAYDFGAPTNVNAYGIVNFANTGFSPVERAPRAWTFEGSNDGTTWTQLDIRRFEKDWTAGEYRYYSFTNAANYSQYRIAITANNGNEYTQFARLEYYHVGDDAGGGGGGDGHGFAKKTTFTPSATALAKIGETAWTDFPVLLRLPATVSSQLRSANGTDLLVMDETGAELPFEVETFAPAGTTFVWAKVPSLSADTVLTVYFGGAANTANEPTAVWTRYAGVWHFAPSAAGTATVPDATGHGLDGTATNVFSAYAGPAGLGALQASAVVRAPDYDANLASAAKFSASGWFKAPTQVNSWWTPASKKVGITTGANGENLWNIDKGWYLQMPQAKDKLNIIYSTSAQMTIPDATENWNYFQVVSDGSTLKVYLNGSSTAAKSVNYAVKASGTPYQICPVNGCSREYRVRIGAASAAETALEYTTMADEAFFAQGAIEDMDTPAVVLPATLRIGAPDAAGGGEPPLGFVENDQGEECFRVVLAEAVPGPYYTPFATTSLAERPVAAANSVTVSAAGPLPFDIPTEGRTSLFVSIVASTDFFHAGDELPNH